MYGKPLTTVFKPDRWRTLLAIAMLSALLAMTGCSNSSDTTVTDSPTKLLDLGLPDSLTGGTSSVAIRNTIPRAAGITKTTSTDEPCFYHGVEDDDVFRNGYRMTQFMVSAVATWTCLTDTIIDLSKSLPHDGLIQEAENDTGATDYEADEPTHYSVSDDSDTQTTVRVYYGYDRSNPPTSGDKPGLFISWNETAEDNITGRLIIDASTIDPANRDPEDPVNMRIDFTYTDSAKLADMSLEQVFTARGLMDMKAQFAPVAGITELPQLHMYTVSDRLGEGAAVAEFVDMSLPLEIDTSTSDHLGNYLFDKTDIYFFDADQRTAEPWDWIDKTITDSQYRGGRNLVAITEADIISFLGLSPSYFSGTECANVGDDCTEMLNAIFADGFAGQEQNQGSNPMDWRSTAITSPAYLGSVYPNGSDWVGAFDPVFTP